jgi:hypothetical protein
MMTIVELMRFIGYLKSIPELSSFTITPMNLIDSDGFLKNDSELLLENGTDRYILTYRREKAGRISYSILPDAKAGTA